MGNGNLRRLVSQSEDVNRAQTLLLFDPYELLTYQFQQSQKQTYHLATMSAVPEYRGKIQRLFVLSPIQNVSFINVNRRFVLHNPVRVFVRQGRLDQPIERFKQVPNLKRFHLQFLLLLYPRPQPL